MTYQPSIGKTPNDWREEEARRRERHERVHNPQGREPTRVTRLVVGWVAALIVVGMVALAILGLAGVLSISAPPR